MDYIQIIQNYLPVLTSVTGIIVVVITCIKKVKGAVNDNEVATKYASLEIKENNQKIQETSLETIKLREEVEKMREANDKTIAMLNALSEKIDVSNAELKSTKTALLQVRNQQDKLIREKR